MRLTLNTRPHDCRGAPSASAAASPSSPTEDASPKLQGFHVRRANRSDLEAIRRCLAEAFEPFRTQYTTEAFADTVPSAAKLRKRSAEMCLFVAEHQEQVIGTIGCSRTNNTEGHLRGMAVLPAWQGSGIATALMDAAEMELRRQGCNRVTLDTTEPLKRAIRFYRRHGFSPTGRVDAFFGMRLYEYAKPL